MNKASNCPRRGALLRRIRVNLTAIRLIGLSFGLSLARATVCSGTTHRPHHNEYWRHHCRAE
jgi:hypothetical protein